MAQLTSLEEICRLYPNLQVDNLDSVQYMVPDDKIIQYTDAQGQQVLAAIDSSNIQFSQAPAPAQQGVFVIEAVETQALETGKSATSYKQPRLVVQQISSAAQPAHQIVGTQQSFIVQQLDHGTTESYFCKDVTDSENKSPCILQNKSENLNPQSQYVIHPIQANLVHLDSSKQQHNSVQTHCLSQQQEINNPLQGSAAKKIDINEVEQSSARQLDSKKVQFQTFVGQIGSLNCQQQCVVQQIESATPKTVVELGKQDRHFIMQQIDGTKQSGFILQHLRSNNHLPNQFLVNQLKGNKNQQAVIQNLDFTEKESRPIKLQNLENTHFIMQNLDGSHQQQVHYQTQHFLVPQGEKLQPKVIVQRVGIPTTVASTPPLIVHQLKPSTSDQETQLVVQQFDLNKQQNLLPYLVSSPAKHSASTEITQEVVEEDLQSSRAGYIFSEKGEENASAQFSRGEGDSQTAESGSNKLDKKQRSVCLEFESQPQSKQLPGNVKQCRINQQSQTPEEIERQVDVQQQGNDSHKRFIQQQVGVNQNHIQRSQEQSPQQSRFYTKVSIAENHQSSIVCQEKTKTGNTIEHNSRLHLPVNQPQICHFIFEDKVVLGSLLKNKQDKLKCNKSTLGDVTSLSWVPVSSLPSCSKIPVKQSESESPPSGLFIIPKGENQFFASQHQPEIRFQGPQLLPQVAKDAGIEINTSQLNDKSSHECDVMRQNIGTQQETSVLLPVTVEDLQKPSNVIGLSNQKSPIRSVKQGTSDQSVFKAGEIMLTSRLQQPSKNRLVTSMIMTSEQHSESSANECERRKSVVQPFGQNLSPQTASSQNQSNSQINVRIGRGGGRGSRGGSNICQKGMSQGSLVARGAQNNAVRPQQNETVYIGIKARDSKGMHSIETGSGQVGPRPIIYQLTNLTGGNETNTITSPVAISVSTSTTTVTTTTSTTATTRTITTATSSTTTCVTVAGAGATSSSSNNINANNSVNHSNENIDGPRMLVLLPNGERKLVRFPVLQQNMHFNQLWQQVRFSLGSQIPIMTNEQLGEKNASGQLIIKGVAVENQESKISSDPPNSTQLVTSTNILQNPSAISSITAIATQQQRPRNVIPRMVTSSTGGTRPRVQCSAVRMPSPSAVNQRMITPPQHHQAQNVMTQTNTFPASGTQVQPLKEVSSPLQHVKEAPKFIAGQVAICPFCGISSLDFNKCIRCRRKLPPNVKSQSIFTVKKKKTEKANVSNEEISQGSHDSDNKNIETTNNENKDKGSSPVSDRKKPKVLPKKKKITDEPAEILILSSDDEEENQQNKIEAARELPILSKEPVYGAMQLTADEIAAATKGSNLIDDLMDNIQLESYTTLQCRSVRIGSYKAQPKDRILMSSKGVRLVIPSLKSENTTVIIPNAEILKILIHFGKQMPVVFIYATPKIGFRIRSQLSMENKSGPYYDPSALQDETHKRITFILEKVTEDNKVALRNMFAQSKLLEELSEREANEILVRASPLEEQGAISTKPTDVVRKIMIYPPPPEKGGIALNNQDYACLGEDQFLNDVIIDFYLKYLLLKVLSPEDRERTHVFSTFFYKRLTTKPKTIRKNDPENDPKLSPAEKRHMRVKGWTKQVNLFEKDFIIVPINEHSHWFLAIICFPGLTGPVKFSDNSPVEPEDIQPKKGARTVQIGNTTITHIVKSERNSVGLEMDQGSDRDEAEGDQDDLHPSSDEEENEQYEEEPSKNSVQIEIPLLDSSHQLSQVQSKEVKAKTVKKKIFKDPIKQPCILIFDSLAGASRVRVVATLRDYLKIEYKKKMGHDREFSKDTIKGAVPKVPQQNNFTDCGLYVLQYVESFFQDPLHDFKLPLKYLQDWFPEEVVSCKRQELANIIRSLMEEQGIKVDEISLPVLTFANGSNTGEEQAKLDDEEEEGNEDEEDLEKTTEAISEFENEEEEEAMDLGEEEEEDEVDEEEEDIYEELELNEIHKSNMHLNSLGSSELDAEGCRVTSKLCITTFDGMNEGNFSRESKANTNEPEKGLFPETYEYVGEIKDYGAAMKSALCKISEEMQPSEQRKNVPLTEFQDFESQISCTTIEKNIENAACETDMIISEGEEDESQIETGNVEAMIVEESFEQKAVECNENIAKEKKAIDVTNIISKLVNVKGITVCRMEDAAGVKQLDNKRVKVNCDTKSDENDENSESNSVKTNSSNVKRSFEALKSVRIPKKAERAVFINKRQRIDET